MTPGLAAAGIAGPLLFTALVIVQGFLQPDYNHIEQPISALAAWPYGWLQNLSFGIASILHATFAIVLHNAIRPNRLAAVGTGLLLLCSVGLMVVAFAPWALVDGALSEPPLHIFGAVLTFSCASLGLILLSRRMAADPGWHGLALYVLVSGIVMLALFILVGFFSIEEGTPLHPWSGLLQRILVGVWFLCQIVIARHALSSRGSDARPTRTA
jgi:hypothetical membrane protein